jgi:hypothetical protein
MTGTATDSCPLMGAEQPTAGPSREGALRPGCRGANCPATLAARLACPIPPKPLAFCPAPHKHPPMHGQDFGFSARVKAVLGPTNTGKTHLAIERMLGHASGIIGFPLRLLARENYDRMAAQKGARNVALITGEEKIVPPDAKWFSRTVEEMPLDRDVEFLAVDEILLDRLCKNLTRSTTELHGDTGLASGRTPV